VLEYRDMGYLPEAVFNFLALLGWSLDDRTEIISREELVKNFSIDRLIASPAVFNIEKLNWMNAEYMRSMPVERLARLLIERLELPEARGGLPDAVERPLNIDYTTRIVPLVRERVKLLPEARDMMAFFYLPAGVEVDNKLLLGKAFADDSTRARLLLSEALVRAEHVERWTHEFLEAEFRELAERLGVRAGDLFMLMRVAVTGRSVAPPLFETMDILGRERCLLRLRYALNLL
jgi:glutamyl-tRNA synthetase